MFPKYISAIREVKSVPLTSTVYLFNVMCIINDCFFYIKPLSEKLASGFHVIFEGEVEL